MANSSFDVAAARGEMVQLRNDLDGNDPETRKKAAMRVVNLMRAGEPMHVLFSSMLRCVKTNDIELKKLAYLYLIRYSSKEPEQAIMAVNTFVQDSQDHSPIIRALAVRNMCRIKLESVAENMIVPLKRCLSDTDAIVRKTASFAVSKLYDVIPDSVENSELFPELLKRLSDDNPMVVANTATAIREINERRTTPFFVFDANTIMSVLNAIPSCSEWCQAMLFETLSKYEPASSQDAQFMIDSLATFLKHNNPAVIVGAFKCMFLFMPYDKDRDEAALLRTILPPMCGLMSSAEPEVQFVVVRTVYLFVQKYPHAFARDVRVFFCKYNDPSYVKMEKLDIIVAVCNLTTISLVLDEFAEYVNSVDVAFVRKTISCITHLALSMESSAGRCVDILVSCLTGKADYAVEEAIIGFCDIIRKFPGSFEGVLKTICASFELLKQAKAKSSALWLLGEFCHIIDKVDLLLDPYLDTFHDEPPLVQLQILVALVKLFLLKPDESRDMLQCVLVEATKESNVPDVRNRAILYWRLLSGDVDTARQLVSFDKRTISLDNLRIDPAKLDELIANMCTVSGVLHILPGSFVTRVKYVPDDEFVANDVVRNWVPLKLKDDALLSVSSDFDRDHMYIRLVNTSQDTLSNFAVAINHNAIGLAMVATPQMPASLGFGESAEIAISIRVDPSSIGNIEQKDLQLAIRTNCGNVFGTGRIPLEIATVDAGQLSLDEFHSKFTSYAHEFTAKLDVCTIARDDVLTRRRIFVVSKDDSGTRACFSFGSDPFLVTLVQNVQSVTVTVKSHTRDLLPLIQSCARDLFAQP